MVSAVLLRLPTTPSYIHVTACRMCPAEGSSYMVSLAHQSLIASTKQGLPVVNELFSRLHYLRRQLCDY